MPAAATTLCTTCSLEAAKYTCPSCSARTCSLACTKAHKLNSCAPASSSSAVPSLTRQVDSSSAAAGSTSNGASNGVSSGGDGDRAKVLSYVPLKQYGEGQMMQDYLFLSSVSRAAAENGRKIVSLNLMPTPDPSQKHTQPNTTNHTRMTNQQRQREQLIKQLNYRKYRVMILPDGMARRKMNQSAFNPKEKRFGLTVEIKAPTQLCVNKGKAKADTEEAEERPQSWVLHKKDSERSLDEVVLGELERRSFTNRKELLKLKQTVPKPASNLARNETWIISKALLVRVQLPIPRSATRVHVEDAATEELIALAGFPRDDWAVAVPSYSARLTNESTTRYLDWWVRKRKWEEANPELAMQQQKDEEDSRPTRRRHMDKERYEGNRWPDRDAANPVEKVEGAEASPPPAPLLESAVAVDASSASEAIISTSLLSILSRRLGRSQPEPTQATAQPPASEPAPPAPTKSQSTAAQSILVHATNPACTSLDFLLRSLPEGYSVVEFPELRILPRAQLDEVQEAGREAVVQLAPETGDVEQSMDITTEEKSVTKDKATSTVTVVTSGSLGGLLAGYESDSDSDSDAAQQDKVEQAEFSTAHNEAGGIQESSESSASLAQLAMLHGLIPASAQQ